MSYWDAYLMPVPFRKYWIQRYNKHKEAEQKQTNTSDINKPLSEQERMQMIKAAQQPRDKSSKSFMNSVKK